MILDSVNSALPSCEVISSEELLGYIDELVNDIDAEGLPEEEVCIDSLDVEALYPILEVETCARICKERVERSKIKFEGIGSTWAGVYIALNCSRAEIVKDGLRELVPVRTAKGGKPPTVLNWDTEEKKEGRWAWRRDKPPEMFNSDEKLKLIAKVTEIIIKATFS